MNKRLAAIMIVIALAVGVFFGREFVPVRIASTKGSAGARYEFLTFSEGGIWRADRQTGEVTAFVLYEGKLRAFKVH